MINNHTPLKCDVNQCNVSAKRNRLLSGSIKWSVCVWGVTSQGRHKLFEQSSHFIEGKSIHFSCTVFNKHSFKACSQIRSLGSAVRQRERDRDRTIETGSVTEVMRLGLENKNTAGYSHGRAHNLISSNSDSGLDLFFFFTTFSHKPGSHGWSTETIQYLTITSMSCTIGLHNILFFEIIIAKCI